MKFLKKLGLTNILWLALCAIIIGVSEYLFMTGEELHGIFVGIWAHIIQQMHINLVAMGHFNYATAKLVP